MKSLKSSYKKYIFPILLAVIIGAIFINGFKQIRLSTKERNAYDIVNEVCTLKLKGNDSYKQFCSESGFSEIQQNWPSGANSFHLIIDDQLFGSYEGKVFFDTGEVYSILTTRRFDGQDKLDSFEKLKWPDKKNGDAYWGID
jgi:hypothetical protein